MINQQIFEVTPRLTTELGVLRYTNLYYRSINKKVSINIQRKISDIFTLVGSEAVSVVKGRLVGSGSKDCSGQ